MLKHEQQTALRHLFEGMDLIGVLLTGFGKSLIFQLFVLLSEVRNSKESQGGKGHAYIIVISPLSSIIKNQILEVNSMGISACNLADKLQCLEEIHRGLFQIVYASTEAAMDKQFVASSKCTFLKLVLYFTQCLLRNTQAKTCPQQRKINVCKISRLCRTMFFLFCKISLSN